MTYTDKSTKLIKKWEGCFLDAYLCPASVPTIGFGTIQYENKQPVKIGDKITQKRADELLKYEMDIKSKQLDSLSLPINQNQFDALLSLIFNIGFGAFRKSRLKNAIEIKADIEAIKSEYLRWNKHRKNGKLVVSVGLNNRRIDELKLFCS